VSAPACCRRAIPAALAAFLALTAARADAQGVEGLLPTPAGADYRGLKVVIDFTKPGTKVTSMSVLCQPGGRERREFHATRGVLVVDGTSAWHYLPEQRIVLKRPSRGEGGEMLQPEQVRRALASYEVRGGAAEPVAGRRSRVLDFLPRQSGSRPRRRVWVDAETGLILRAEVYGIDSRLAWVSVFEELEYHPAVNAAVFTMRVPAGARVVDAGADPCLEPAAAERIAGLPMTLPAYLPAGFERQCIRARRQGRYGEIQVVFGDGLSLLSLFASTSFHDTGEDQAAQTVAVGPWQAHWRDLGLVTGIQWGTPWAHLALLGEISRTELLKVAGSVPGPRELSVPAAHQ
jgi:outer membrane lipoprotein-sorting protein